MAQAYIGLGSNLGNSLITLKQALERLNQNQKMEVIKTSSFYKTSPVGYKDQDDFVNAVALLETSLPPLELLDHLLNLEQEFKRVRLFKNGPRTLDLDLLLYDNLIMDTSKLILPHPRMCERAFVLVPLNEIAPTLIIPKSERVVNSFYASLNDAELKDVRLLEHA
ncbi:MAG: 2-amino-4-hydroxy-6-hydroxymethyldihydropteridine diphosphokinase [Succinatimonas sp.]|nr:2-amino-4-hydroxy-6-hydroxymethyldihydropteridine diphosphokinase [Succinatimonas sp.]